jgi:hypothetical protein
MRLLTMIQVNLDISERLQRPGMGEKRSSYRSLRNWEAGKEDTYDK